jgi:hypothetical protein
MPSVRRGLSDRVHLKALEIANQRAALGLPVPVAELEAAADLNAAAELEAAADLTAAADARDGSRAPTASPPDVGTDAEPDRQPPRAAFDPLEKARWAALVAAKAATIAFGVDALLNADSPRFAGKAMRVRAIGYIGTLFIVPLAWRLLPDRGRYPRGLDTAVTIPLLLDAAGNGLGIYEDAHVDDVVHIANAAIVSGVAGALLAPRVDERWHAALVATSLAITAEAVWEIMEYTAWRMGATGMGLTYADTMDDIIDSTLGAIVGGLFTLARLPHSRQDRKRVGWRSPLGA